jgi:hypothetical protein
MNVAATKEYSVSEVAQLATNRKGGKGVAPQYIREQIKLYNDTKGERGLHARLIENPPAGRSYYLITEEDFLAWEEKRGRSPGDEP